MVALPIDLFPLFLKKHADVLGPCLSVEFRQLIHLASFLACWRQANVISIPKDPTSSFAENYRPISVTSVLSKVFERLVLVHFVRFMEHSGVLAPLLAPPPTLLIGKVWVPVMHFCACPIHCKCIGEWQETKIPQIGFSAAFDWVNHHGILYKLCSLSIGGSVLSIFTQFQSNRSHQVIVDGCQSKLVNVVSIVPLGSVSE